ncbi:hypothetical protein [Thiolapillus brandeum]|uniref:hypothetical protein n=1 Tax=Thiolapillus brandeum TaxID=1076588 RepID=UPI000597C6A9|nr:hypothetical protein [Thiolapillus brandeum]
MEQFDYSDYYRQQYESGLIEEARAMVAGQKDAQPTVEHVRVLLEWLDGCMYEPKPATQPPF